MQLPNPDDDFLAELEDEEDDGFEDGYDDLELEGFDEFKEY